MTKKEAREQNLYYTGMSFNSWDREKREYYKNRVKEIKSIYNVRLVLVNECWAVSGLPKPALSRRYGSFLTHIHY